MSDSNMLTFELLSVSSVAYTPVVLLPANRQPLLVPVAPKGEEPV